MDFEFDTNDFLMEQYELATELEYDFYEVTREIHEAYEDMLHTQYDEIDRLYW